MSEDYTRMSKRKKSAYLASWAALVGDETVGVQRKPKKPVVLPDEPLTPLKTDNLSTSEKRNPYRLATWTKKPRKEAPEAAEQIPLVNWARKKGLLLHSIPNGGKRSFQAGYREKALGLWPGACDLFLAMARQGFHGFYIEMKGSGEKPRQNQLEFMALVRTEGFKAEWFDNYEKAKTAIEEYLSLS